VRKTLCLLVTIFFIWVNQGLAQPPAQIDFEYDSQTKMLKVKIAHISINVRRHYIRRLIVTKNSENPQDFYYTNQPQAEGMTVDVPLVAKTGDTIKVKAICSQAGYKEETYLVP